MTFKLVGVGEVLWDLLPDGRQLGGAPANFAYHARALGADARVISRVGKDPLGEELVERLNCLGVPTDCLAVDDTRPTGTVSVEVAPNGEPHFTIHQDVAWDNLSLTRTASLAVAAANAVCFGTLAQRSDPARSTIRALLQATPPVCLRVVDVNLRQHFYSRAVIEESLARANVLKVTESELPILAEMFALRGDERAQMSQLAQRHQLRAVAYTRGASGSLLLADGRWSDHPGVPARVVDTVGAGDSFTAAMVLGLLVGWDLDKINRHANALAAHVASCAGATPALPDHFKAAFRDCS